MAVHYRTQGLILDKEDRSEADQVFTTYTKDFGKLEILGKAVRKIKSKLRGGAEIFYFSEIEFVQGKAYKTLTDAILVDALRSLKRDLIKLRTAYQIAEISDALIKGQEPDERIWELFVEVFGKLSLNNFRPQTCSLLYYYFLWNLLSNLGYQPEFYNCSICQTQLIPGELYFNSGEGGIICAACFKEAKKDFKNEPASKEINLDTVKILRLLIEQKWNILSKLKLEQSHLKILDDISKDFLSTIPFPKYN